MKQIKLLFVILLFSCTLDGSSKPVEEVQPDTGQRFKLYQSLISSHPDGKDTILWVILCANEVEELDEIFNEIKMFTEHMNDESNRLTIHLYRSKIELDNCRILETKTYIKGELEYEKD